MRPTPPKRFEGQTDEQFTIGLKNWRESHDRQAKIANLFETWRQCKFVACKRQHACRQDPFVCFRAYRKALTNEVWLERRDEALSLVYFVLGPDDEEARAAAPEWLQKRWRECKLRGFD